MAPHIAFWIKRIPGKVTFIEPFCGGASTSFIALGERNVERVVMAEKDVEVAALWTAVLDHPVEMERRIRSFVPDLESVTRIERQESEDPVDRGFRALVLNRTRRGGIMASGAGLIRAGENGAGLSSRWYPDTLCSRLKAISTLRHRIEFIAGDGMTVLEEHSRSRSSALFVDPPYTAGGKNAGRRLYDENEVDHERIFTILHGAHCPFMMTYDRSDPIEELIDRHGFHTVTVRVRNTHHKKIEEMIVTRTAILPEVGESREGDLLDEIRGRE